MLKNVSYFGHTNILLLGYLLYTNTFEFYYFF